MPIIEDNGDVHLIADTGGDGLGRIIFSTGHVERASIGANGVVAGNILSAPKYDRRRLDNSRGNDRKAMTSPPTLGASTTVTGSNALNSAVINVGATTNFPAAGTATINGVAVTYTGVTSTTLTGCGTHAAYTGGETVTITFGTSSGITSGIKWPSVQQGAVGVLQYGEHFTYHGGASYTIHGTSFPDSGYVRPTSLTTIPATVPGLIVASFYFDGTTLELLFKGMTGFVQIKVDDEYVSLTPTSVTATGSTYFMPVTFASRLTRRIDVIMSDMVWGGVQTGPNDTIIPAETRGPRMIVIGDSFTEGTGADGGRTSNWTRTFADLMGWDDVWASGVGQTGILNPGTGGKVKFRDRIAHDVIAYNPSIVVIAGGINDYASYSASAIGAEAALLFTQIVAGLPNALLVVVSPFWRNGPSTMPSTLIAARDAIKTAAQAVGATFLDVLEMPLPSWLTPVSTTLAANVLANATSCSLNAILPARSVIQIGTDRMEVKSVSGGGPYTHTLDGTFINAHTSGDTVTQVGPTLWTGTGKVGTTTGYGNSDLMVIADGTHPSQVGHNILGTTLARALIASAAI